MTVKELHRKAMKFNDLAIIAKRDDPSMVSEYFRKAFEFEKKAFVQFNSESNVEPTRTVLLRSSANLAMLAGYTREAEKLIAIGLAGDPPDELANELRDVLQQVSFFKRVETNGSELDSNEIQLSLSGNEVGRGIVRSDEFLNRVEVIEKLAFRTANRLKYIPFKEKRRKKKSNVIEFEPFLSVSKKASFAVIIRFGQFSKPSNGETESPQYLIDDLLKNIKILNEGNINKLSKTIKEEDYRRNFIALTRQLAPDGDRVKLVGFSVKRNNQINTVPLTKIKSDFNINEVINAEDNNSTEYIELIGVLSYANSKNNIIRLTDKEKKDHTIIVPKGLLSDVVKPYFEEEVVLRGKKIGKNIVLDDLELYE